MFEALCHIFRLDGRNTVPDVQVTQDRFKSSGEVSDTTRNHIVTEWGQIRETYKPAGESEC